MIGITNIAKADVLIQGSAPTGAIIKMIGVNVTHVYSNNTFSECFIKHTLAWIFGERAAMFVLSRYGQDKATEFRDILYCK